MGDTTKWISNRKKRRDPKEEELAREGQKNKKPDDVSIILEVDEGPAKRHKTMKTFKIKAPAIPKLRLAKRGGGRAYGKNS